MGPNSSLREIGLTPSSSLCAGIRPVSCFPHHDFPGKETQHQGITQISFLRPLMLILIEVFKSWSSFFCSWISIRCPLISGFFSQFPWYTGLFVSLTFKVGSRIVGVGSNPPFGLFAGSGISLDFARSVCRSLYCQRVHFNLALQPISSSSSFIPGCVCRTRYTSARLTSLRGWDV